MKSVRLYMPALLLNNLQSKRVAKTDYFTTSIDHLYLSEHVGVDEIGANKIIFCQMPDPVVLVPAPVRYFIRPYFDPPFLLHLPTGAAHINIKYYYYSHSSSPSISL